MCTCVSPHRGSADDVSTLLVWAGTGPADQGWVLALSSTLGSPRCPTSWGRGRQGAWGSHWAYVGILEPVLPFRAEQVCRAQLLSGSWVSSLEEATPEAGWSLGVVGGAARGLAREAGGGGWSVALVLPTSATRASVSHL